MVVSNVIQSMLSEATCSINQVIKAIDEIQILLTRTKADVDPLSLHSEKMVTRYNLLEDKFMIKNSTIQLISHGNNSQICKNAVNDCLRLCGQYYAILNKLRMFILIDISFDKESLIVAGNIIQSIKLFLISYNFEKRSNLNPVSVLKSYSAKLERVHNFINERL